MKASKLKKDKIRSVRINSELEEKLKEMGLGSVQKFLDDNLDTLFKIEIVDNQLVFEEEDDGN